jgi:hypothetical protein
MGAKRRKVKLKIIRRRGGEGGYFFGPNRWVVEKKERGCGWVETEGGRGDGGRSAAGRKGRWCERCKERCVEFVPVLGFLANRRGATSGAVVAKQRYQYNSLSFHFHFPLVATLSIF